MAVNQNSKDVAPAMIDLKQRSEEWHAFRLMHLGSSETPIILRTSFWESPFGLFLLKTGQKKPKKENAATNHGHEEEPWALDWYTNETGNFASPAVLEMRAWPEWMLYDDLQYLTPEVLSWSADGWSKRSKLAVEIKCPFEIEAHLQALEGTVPAEFYPQTQHALLVSGAERLDYVSYYPDHKIQGVVIPVSLDRDYVVGTMLPALDQFWGYVKKNDYPIPSGEHTFIGEAEIELAEKARIAFAMLKEAERTYETAKARLLGFCGPYAKSHVGKIDVIQTYRRGYSYDATVAPTITLSIKRHE